MRRSRAGLGSAVFFLLAPGTLAGLVPWRLTDGWHAGHSWPAALRALGVVAVLSGVAVLVSTFGLFAVVGRGTPAPVAPPRQLVVRGAYRHVRNPMYVAVLAIILGQALVLGSSRLVWYAIAFWAIAALFVRIYEEPTLQRAFGKEYVRYRRDVRAWIPRILPWNPDGASMSGQPATARPGGSDPPRGR